MALQGKEREAFEKKLEAYVGIEIGIEEATKGPIDASSIRQWCEALGDELPIYTDPEAAASSIHGELVAPPTMLQAWVLPGMEMALGEDDPRNKQRELHRLFDAEGMTGVVATNCEQGFNRYLKVGDELRAVTTIESISEQKATGLGIGYFINTRSVFQDQKGEDVAWMTFRVLKFEAAQQPQAEASDSGGAPAKPTRIRPSIGHDNQFWWEGIDRGELLIQKCGSCGELRHPPRPMCPSCQSKEWESIVSSGKGTVYSHVTLHYPEVPGYEYPCSVAVVDLEEGTRFVSNVVGCDPDEVHIGMPVQASIEEMDPEFKMAVFRPVPQK